MDSLPEIKINTSGGGPKKPVSGLKAAGSLIAKQAERTTIATVTLPRAFATLGKATYKINSRRDSFAELFAAVDSLLSQRKAIAKQGAQRTAGSGLADKAKKAASDTADFAKTQVIDLQILHAYSKLGEAVYDEHGEDAGVPQLVQPISKAISRRNQLDRDLFVAKEAASHVRPTKGVVVGSAVVIAVLLVLGGIRLRGGSDEQTSRRSRVDKKSQSSTSQGRKATASRKQKPSFPLRSELEKQGYDEGWEKGAGEGDWWASALKNAVKQNNPASMQSITENIYKTAEEYGSIAERNVQHVADFEKQTGKSCEEMGQSNYLYSRAYSAGMYLGFMSEVGRFMK